MALIDALMAGQQFVSGIQQQQQMAREYRDRMAMLAREEERAMRQEERQMMADFRTQEMQDFQMGLARSAEERAVSAEKRAVIDSNLGREEAKQRMRANDLEIRRLQGELDRLPTIQAQQDALFEIQRITAENEQLASSLELELTRDEIQARRGAAATEKEFTEVQSSLTRMARRAVLDPKSITPQEVLEAEDFMYGFLERNPRQTPAIAPYYRAFFDAVGIAEKEKGSLLTERGIREKYRKEYSYIPEASFNFDRYLSGLQEAYKPLVEYEKRRDQGENFLSAIGRPMADAVMGMLPQED